MKVLIAVLLCVSSLFGDEVVRTKDGRNVMLKDDGTWHYVEEKPSPALEQLTCDDLINSPHKDKMTGNSWILGKRIFSVDGPILHSNILGDRAAYSIGFAFKKFQGNTTQLEAYVEDGCIRENEKMNILFRDGSRMELINEGGFNCDRIFRIFFGNGKNLRALERLRTKEIEAIRVGTTEGYYQVEFPKNPTSPGHDSKSFMKTFDCMWKAQL